MARQTLAVGDYISSACPDKPLFQGQELPYSGTLAYRTSHSTPELTKSTMKQFPIATLHVEALDMRDCMLAESSSPLMNMFFESPSGSGSGSGSQHKGG